MLKSLVAREVRVARLECSSTRATLAALPTAWGTVWASRADILRYLRTGEDALAFELRRRFGLGPPLGAAQPIPPDIFADNPMSQAARATIIVPVFNAFEDTARLLRQLTETLAREIGILLVDDGSDDPRIAPLLHEFTTRVPSARVLVHSSNQGFVAAVNTGLNAVPKDSHVILLNTDALPPANWVSRLLAPLAEDNDVASVTPLSNNAEVLSIPRPGTPVELAPEFVTAVDQTAARIGARLVEMPTGIGFCMALNRKFLDRVGGFDTAFGRGYGEEVDWCRKAAMAGGRHVVATNLFVGHRGCASFGPARKRAQVAKAGRVIAARYPDYADAVLDWEQRDPIGPERLAVSLAWVAATATAPVPVFIAHALGGGAETALRREIAGVLSGGAPAVVILRAGGTATWRVEVQGERFTVIGDVGSAGLVHRLLAPIARRHVVYSCAVGAADPASVPETLLRLAGEQRLDIRMHDYFPVSPSWNLLAGDGHYRGIPALDETDPAHALPANAGRPGLSHREWRRRWSMVTTAATEITVFAASGKQLIEEAYPHVAGKVAIRPHRLDGLPRKVAKGGTNIGILGGINRAKGAQVLEGLATRTARQIVVIGEMDGQFRLPPPHVVHGRYKRAEISELSERYGIGLWFIPSICPETFSFATHETLATGLPVMSFDLGAQGETLRTASRGHVLCTPPDDLAAVHAEIERLLS
ncbi:MAG: glycosyltransferase [Silicimonas sp.]|nr:glycosyltransferase [Silicimonas sp.]